MNKIDKKALEHITFYSASAGSGKTYTLTHKIAELVDPDAEKRYDPSELILTTFTVAAADDFKARAREVLYEKGYFEQAQQLDMAQIGTIDSIAQDMVSRYWYLCGQSPNLNVIDEKGQKRYIRQSLSGLVKDEDIQLYNKVYNQFRFTKKKEGGSGTEPDSDYWMKWLETMVTEMVTYGITNLDESKEESKEWLKEILQPKAGMTLPTVEQRQAWANALLGFDTKESDSQKERVKSYKKLESEELTFDDYRSIAKSVSGCPKKNRPNEVVDCIDTLPNYIYSKDVYDLLCEAIDHTFELVKTWDSEYKKFKSKHQLIDFSDMERLFLELLNREEIEEEMRGRYKVLMVDEFQDSNPLQVKIFLRLNELVEKSYWCGDPKQSIYGFRGSDYELTTTVADLIAQNEKNLVKKDTNYRSVPSLVKFANELFDGKFPVSNSVTVTLQPDRKEKEDGQQTLLHWQAAAGNKDSFAKDLAHRIKEFAKERGLKWTDIAVLGMDRYALAPLAEHLDDIGVPVNYTTGKLVETREVVLMQSLMALASDDTNAQARAQVAFLTDENYNLGEIIDKRLVWLAKKDYAAWLDDCMMIKTMVKIAPKIRLLGLPEQMEALYGQLGLRSVFERWGNAPQRESNVVALIQAARTYEQRMRQFGEGSSASDFFTTIDDEQAAGNIKGVTLTTYFKSKGLEWPVVIMVSMDSDKATEDRVMNRSVFGITHLQKNKPTVDDPYPTTLLTLLPWPYGSATKVPQDTQDAIKGSKNFQTIYEREKKEMMRLLYVGVTRARDCLVITGSQNAYRGNPSGTPLDKQTWLSSLDFDVEEIMGKGGKLLWEDMPHVEEDDEEISEEEKVKVLNPQWKDDKRDSRFLSPSMSNEKHKVKLELLKTTAPEIKQNITDSKLMTKVGTCIHNIFAVGADESAATNTIETFGLTKELPSAESITASWQGLVGELTKLHGKAEKEYHEVPFDFMADNGQIVRGEIDFVWETADGVVLVDFKTHLGKTEDGEGDADLKKDIISRHYPAQLALYTKALQLDGKEVLAQYLFFPLGGQIVKVLFVN